MPRRVTPAIDRIHARASRVGDCLVYEGSAARNGYGYVSIGSRAGGVRRPRKGVHVVALEHALGRELEAGEMALHDCDVKLCIEPTHLYAGDHADNMRDRDERGRTTKGEAKPQSRLTVETVAKARDLRASGLTYRELGERFAVSAPTVWKALNGQTWQ